MLKKSKKWMLAAGLAALMPLNTFAADYTWRFALEEIQGSVQDAYAQEFKRRVEEGSQGRVEVQVYPYGALGTSAQLTELVQNQAIQFAFASPGHLGAVIPEVQVFSLHFIFSDNNAVNKSVLANSQAINQLLAQAYAEKNLELLSIVPEGWMVWTGDRALNTPEAFKDFKIRTMTSPLLVEAYRAYGANPTPMPYSEVYSGLQLKQIDGQVNPIFAIEEMSFYEVQTHMTFARQAQFVTSLVANKTFFDGLPQDLQKLVKQVRTELVDHIYDVQHDFNQSRLQKIKENSDIKMVELTEAEREAFRKASLDVRQTYVEQAGQRGQEVLNTLLAEIKAAETKAAAR